MSTTVIVATVAVLAVGTYLIRLAGLLLADRIRLPETGARLLPLAATALLTALAITSALFEAAQFAGFARPIGVVVGVVLAWRRLPFAVVIIAAAATAATLRALGVS